MYLQLDTKFNPFTYDEMVKPLLYYKQAYDEAEAAYSALSSDTDVWKNKVNRDESPQAYEQFQRYSGDLTRTVDDFSRGMTAKNRRALLGLKRRYASEIKPIEEAYNRRTTLAEEQRKAELNNPTMLWQRRASEMSLDDFINNPNADYGKSTSGAALSAQVAAGAGALAKEFRDNPEKMRKLVGGDYYEYVKQRGFSSEAVLAAIMDNPDASPVLTQLVESSIDSAGLREWADASTLKQAYNYARQGLWNAVGQDEAQLVQNWRAQENLSHSHAMARQAAAQAFQAAEAEKDRAFRKEESDKAAALTREKLAAKAKADSQRANRLKNPVKVRATNKGNGSGDYVVGASWDVETIPDGAAMKAYGSLTPEQKKVVDTTVGTDTREGYNYYVIQEDASGVGTGDDDLVIIVPKTTVTNDVDHVDTDAY